MTCQHCGTPFTANAINQKFCNPKCKNRFIKDKEIERRKLVTELSRKWLSKREFILLDRKYRFNKAESDRILHLKDFYRFTI